LLSRARFRPPPQSTIDWDALSRETVHVLADYIKVNSTNPPGNALETAGIRYLYDVLRYVE
jgi:hypothetical protein